MPERIEKFIQYFWKKNNTFILDTKYQENKYYCLCMFPYPSGKLHIGHVRNYVIGDIISGYSRLKGLNVLNTIGWDSFGMPAENAAYSNNINPKDWTEQNIFNMRRQLKRLGFSFDWSKEITTSNPNYYKWEQLFFIKLYKSGLVYKKDGFINWDPIEKTVLANEQVINGRGWRSNALVKRVKIQQWYLRITDYANELIEQLDLLSGWPNKVKEMQKHWIGRKVKFELLLLIESSEMFFNIFIDDICDIYLIKKVIIFKDHVLCDSINRKNIYLVNPLIKCKIKLNFKKVFNNTSDETFNCVMYKSDDLFKRINFFFRYIKISCINIILFKLFFFKKNIKLVEVFRLQDWCVSRQRYWGSPIPIIYCDVCGVMTENENNLPVVLPNIQIKKYMKISLKKKKNFYLTRCQLCNRIAHRETDTFDTFFESSWYYVKYLCKDKIDVAVLNKWLPVDYYIGGIEHATMHLIYARFFHKIMRDFCIVISDEPFNNLLTQGMVLMDGSKMSKSKGNIPDQEKLIECYGADTVRLFVMFCAAADQSFEWTSNGINGCKKFLDKIWRYSYILKNKFADIDLDEKEYDFTAEQLDVIIRFNHIVDNIYINLSKYLSFNVVIAYLMQMLKLLDKNILISNGDIYLAKRMFKSLLLFLLPIAPHIVNFIWMYILKYCIDIFNEVIPTKILNKYLYINVLTVAVFVNNKFRTKVIFSSSLNEDEIKNFIFQQPVIQKYLFNRTVKNFIYKENKIINIII